MGTFNDKKIIDHFIEHNGYYEDDPRVIRIVEYVNNWGGTCWGVVYIQDPPIMWFRYDLETDFVHNPKVLWTCLTMTGEVLADGEVINSEDNSENGGDSR